MLCWTRHKSGDCAQPEGSFPSWARSGPASSIPFLWSFPPHSLQRQQNHQNQTPLTLPHQWPSLLTARARASVPDGLLVCSSQPSLNSILSCVLWLPLLQPPLLPPSCPTWMMPLPPAWPHIRGVNLQSNKQKQAKPLLLTPAGMSNTGHGAIQTWPLYPSCHLQCSHCPPTHRPWTLSSSWPHPTQPPAPVPMHLFSVC